MPLRGDGAPLAALADVVEEPADDEAERDREQQDDEQRRARLEEDEVHVDGMAIGEDDDQHVERDHAEDDPPERPGALLARPLRRGWRRHAAILRSRRRHEWGGWAQNEARLAGRLELSAGGDGAERGADVLARKGAEALAAEIAIV